MIRIGSEATDLSPVLDLSGPVAEPPVDPEPRAIPEGADRADEPAAIPVGSPAGWAIDAALDELAPGAGLAPDGGGVAGAAIAVERVRIDGPTRPVESPRDRGLWPSRLAAILLAAGWFGRGIAPARGREFTLRPAAREMTSSGAARSASTPGPKARARGGRP